jgi:N-acetylmuramoyl-L-alanine amidase
MILRKGLNGKEVIRLQNLLKINADGIFGPATERAVIEFQKQNNLTADGVVGPRTWNRLLESMAVTITPTYPTTIASEDFSDPEEKFTVERVKEQVPTSSNITELINLINKSKITRRVTRLVFHCTATAQTATVSAIQKYWREKLRWANPGYHIIVKPDGSWTQLADFNGIANGVAGINANSIHISYIGGVDSRGRAIDNRTPQQREIFETAYRAFREKMPALTFHGHEEFSNKACPSFKVKTWIESLPKQ